MFYRVFFCSPYREALNQRNEKSRKKKNFKTKSGKNIPPRKKIPRCFFGNKIKNVRVFEVPLPRNALTIFFGGVLGGSRQRDFENTDIFLFCFQKNTGAIFFRGGIGLNPIGGYFFRVLRAGAYVRRFPVFFFLPPLAIAGSTGIT
jgi:hypothetical protein